MPPPLGGGRRPLIFLRCRSPYRAWLFIHFSSLPRRKTNQKEGGPRREKNSACGLKQLFPKRETSRTASSELLRLEGHIRSQSHKTVSPGEEGAKTVSTNHRDIKMILLARQGKESGLRLLTAFPGAGNADCFFYPLYKGAAGKSAGRSEFICKSSLFSHNSRGGPLDSGKAV